MRENACLLNGNLLGSKSYELKTITVWLLETLGHGGREHPTSSYSSQAAAQRASSNSTITILTLERFDCTPLCYFKVHVQAAKF